MPEQDKEFGFSDQREHIRIPFRGKVSVRPLSGKGVWWFRLRPIRGVAVSISQNGSRMVLHTEVPMHIGSRLRANMQVPFPRKTFHFEAYVRWQRRHDDASSITVGLEITKLPEKEVKLWVRFIEVLRRSVQGGMTKQP